MMCWHATQATIDGRTAALNAQQGFRSFRSMLQLVYTGLWRLVNTNVFLRNRKWTWVHFILSVQTRWNVSIEECATHWQSLHALGQLSAYRARAIYIR